MFIRENIAEKETQMAVTMQRNTAIILISTAIV